MTDEEREHLRDKELEWRIQELIVYAMLLGTNAAGLMYSIGQAKTTLVLASVAAVGLMAWCVRRAVCRIRLLLELDRRGRELGRQECALWLELAEGSVAALARREK